MIPIYIGFNRKLVSFFSQRKSKAMSKINDIVKIMENIKKAGDKAIHYYNRLYYKVDTHNTGLFVSKEDIDDAYDRLSQEYISSLEQMINRMRSLERKILASLVISTSPASNIHVTYVFKPLNRVGFYIPSNSPLIALSTVVPAIVAGVKNIIVASPPNYYGDIHPGVLTALDILGVKKIFRSCGPAGISAMAFGTRSIGKVDKIIGIGDDVRESLKMVADYVETQYIDVSKKLVLLVDKTAEPEYLIWDMYSWVENKPDSNAVLVTVDKAIAENVVTLHERFRRSAFIRRYSDLLESRLAVVIAGDWDEAIGIVNRLSPDYVELIAERDVQYRLLDYIKNAGTILVGMYSPPSYVEYFSGIISLSRPGLLRKSLSVQDFVRFTRVVRVEPDALINDFEDLQSICDAGHMPSHFFSVKKRMDNL